MGLIELLGLAPLVGGFGFVGFAAVFFTARLRGGALSTCDRSAQRFRFGAAVLVNGAVCAHGLGVRRGHKTAIMVSLTGTLKRGAEPRRPFPVSNCPDELLATYARESEDCKSGSGHHERD